MSYANSQPPFQPYSDHDNSSKPSFQQGQGDTAAWGETAHSAYPPDHPVASYAAGPTTGYSPVTAHQHPETYDNNSMPVGSSSGPLWSAEKYPPPGGSKRKWWLIGGGVALVAIIVIGIAVGVSVKKHSSASSSSSGSGTGTGGTPNPSNTNDWTTTVNGVVKYNPKDMSQFQTDPRLLPSFYGIAYSPAGSILPSCGASFDQVLEDVYLMSQLTTRIRLYGTDCNATELVIDAIQQTKTNLSVYVGIYVTNDVTVYQRQRNETQHIIETYGTDQILGITVGNEFILDNMTALGVATASGSAGIAAADFLLTLVQDMRTTLSGLNLKKTLPVGNGDAGAYTNVKLLSGVDYFMSNIHPWFGNLPVNQAAGWTWQFFQDNNVNLAAQTSNHPDLMIAEVGWPSGSNDTATNNDGPSLASVPDLQTFMNSWICQSNANGTHWFWFEFFDEEWKNVTYGGVEGYWGLFDQTKHLKNVTIPNCKSS